MSDHSKSQLSLLEVVPDSDLDIRQFVGRPFDGVGYLAVVGFLYYSDPSDAEITPPRQVALIRKTRPPWQAGKLNGIGGRVEFGETALDAQVREFEEETKVHGLTRDDWRPFAVISGKDERGPWAVAFFVAEIYESVELHSDNDEKPEWFSLVGVTERSDVIPNLKWLIPMSLDKDKVMAHVREPKPNGQDSHRKVPGSDQA